MRDSDAGCTHLVRVMALLALCAACDRAAPGGGGREPAAADAGRLLWSAFECSSYADMAGRPEEQQRLLGVGVDIGRRFVDGVRNKTIPEAEISSTVPVAVLTAMAGPTTDFVLGRIYATAAQQAFDRVSKEDSSGIVQPVEEWVLDKKVQVIRADARYNLGNCALLE